ncbi:tripartite tricarboxylate transporter TctB family protein [Phaeobacter porticola]|uniref:Tripartite tricarboxylate transporter TctB family protein n=1 Tax=Phaeobacter porticola TaxID=1844006 RepID=A0A1L3IAV5_9RHOB|nr:tripartite tricarboxylate transporter TctB family protein [Phaeobacter porticola]APG49163.1 Tripartite tricarboxylate transporter TctB family protein [Phaeobacter porticola]
MTLQRISGVFFVIFAATMIWGVIPAQTETVYPDGSIPPEVLPSVYAAVIGLFGGALACQREEAHTLDLRQAAKTTGVYFIALAGVLAMKHFGFLLAAPALALGLLWLVGERRPLWLAIGGLAGPLLIWTVFEVLLGRLLP